jgi:hypothetical protein
MGRLERLFHSWDLPIRWQTPALWLLLKIELQR